MTKSYGEIMHRLQFLYHYYDVTLHPEQFKFEIGARVFQIIKSNINTYQLKQRDEKISLFGIDVEINFHEVDCIKLWKECSD